MSNSSSNIVDIDVQVHAETDHAVLVSDDGERDHAVWLPLSQIEIQMEEGGDGTATVSMPEWLATEKGLV